MAGKKNMKMPDPAVGAALITLRQDFIKFDPEKIMEVSTGLEQQHKKFTQAAATIKRRAESLMASWKSDSADLYMKKIGELDAQSNEIAGELLSLSQDLAKASGIYKTGESEAKKKAEALPTEGVFLV